MPFLGGCPLSSSGGSDGGVGTDGGSDGGGNDGGGSDTPSLTATTETSVGAITVSWNDTDFDAGTAFDVCFAHEDIEGTAFSNCSSLTGGSLNKDVASPFSRSDLLPDTYYLQVRARRDESTLDTSDVLSAKVPTPSLNASTETSFGEITVSWNDTDFGAGTAFDVCVAHEDIEGTAFSNCSVLAGGSLNKAVGTAFSQSDLFADTYYVQVRARRDGTAFDTSEVLSAEIEAQWQQSGRTSSSSYRGSASVSDGTEVFRTADLGYIDWAPTIDANGTIYFGTRTAQVYAYKRNGSQRWSSSTIDDYPNSSPAIRNRKVYVAIGDKTTQGFLEGTFKAVEVDKGGEAAWTEYVDAPVYGSTTSSDGTVYAGTFMVDTTQNNKLHARDPEDGSKKWTYPVGRPVRSAAVQPKGSAKVYVTTGHSSTKDSAVASKGELHAVNASDGSKAWVFTPSNRSIDDSTIASQPMIAQDGTVVLGTNDGNVFAVNPGDGSVAWSRDLASNAFVTVAGLRADGKIYATVFGEAVYLLNPSNGGATVWQTSASALSGDLAGQGPGAVDPDGNFYVSHSGGISRLDGSDGSEAWHYSLSGSYNVTSGIAIGHEGTAYFGTGGANDEGRLYAIE